MANMRLLTNSKKGLEREIELLKAEEEVLQKELLNKTECVGLFEKWSGINVQDTPDGHHVKFTPMVREEEKCTYTLGLTKRKEGFTVNYINMPSSIKNIPQTVSSLTLDELHSLLFTLFHEVYSFVKRKEDAKEAMSLTNPKLSLWTSSNSRKAIVCGMIDDAHGDSNLSKVVLTLSYSSDNMLPDDITFSFVGGDRESRAQLEEQLQCFRYLPLKDALIAAFDLVSIDSQCQESQDGSIS